MSRKSAIGSRGGGRKRKVTFDSDVDEQPGKKRRGDSGDSDGSQSSTFYRIKDDGELGRSRTLGDSQEKHVPRAKSLIRCDKVGPIYREGWNVYRFRIIGYMFHFSCRYNLSIGSPMLAK